MTRFSIAGKEWAIPVGDGGGVGLLAGVGPEGDCCIDDMMY